jgi:hypothetical protein
MHNTFGLVIGAVCMVLALMSIRAFFDRDCSRPRWARQCLVVLAIAAAMAGIMTGLEVSERGGFYIRPSAARHAAGFCRGLTIGLLLALSLSGQWLGKKPPQ